MLLTIPLIYFDFHTESFKESCYRRTAFIRVDYKVIDELRHSPKSLLNTQKSDPAYLYIQTRIFPMISGHPEQCHTKSDDLNSLIDLDVMI